jgi:hypothetical protein
MRPFLVIVALLIWCLAPARANVIYIGDPPVYCAGPKQLYSSASPDAPAPIAAALKGRDARLFFGTCTDTKNSARYYVFLPIMRADGICRVHVSQIYRVAGEEATVSPDSNGQVLAFFSLKDWSYGNPLDPNPGPRGNAAGESYDLATVSDGACPPANDPGYYTVNNVTPGMLRGVTKLWKEMTASPAAMDAALKTIPYIDYNDTIDRLPEGSLKTHFLQTRQAQIERFRTAALSGKLPWTMVRCDEHSCSLWFTTFILSFDVSDRGVVFTRLSPVVAA